MANQTKKPTRADSAREALEAALAPGETLQDYTVAKFVAGFLSNQEYWIGLSDRRFIFMRPKKNNQVYSIYFAFVQDVVNAALTPKSKQPFLQIQLSVSAGVLEKKYTLKFVSLQAWSFFTNSMVQTYAQMRSSWENQPARPTSAQVLDLVQNLQGLGAQNMAQELLRRQMENDPYLKSEDKAQDLAREMKTTKFAMRLAAALFGIVLLYFIWATTQGLAQIGFGIIFAVIAIYNLLRGNAAARGTALGLVMLDTGLNLVINLLRPTISPIDVIAWCAFGVSMTLLLVGRPNFLRIALGAGVFAVGVVGLFAFVVFGGSYFPDAVKALLPAPSGPYTEDFAKKTTWGANSNERVAAGQENGKYFILVKQPGLAYFSFPPITYLPWQGEVDVQVPADFAANPAGAYGLVCRYQNGGKKYYEFIVDPANDRYGVERIEGENDYPLTDPIWQPTTAFRDAAVGNRIGMACRDNQVTMTVNGVQLPAISDPQMAEFGDGKLGLTVLMWTDAEQAEFKVLFDNVKFWPQP